MMNWKSLFKPVKTMDPDEAKVFVRQRTLDEVQLLNVRQPQEYEREHLPGAKLIPLKQLPEESASLDKGKPLLVYCATGGRSRAAAHLLEGQGFTEVYNVTGGHQGMAGP